MFWKEFCDKIACEFCEIVNSRIFLSRSIFKENCTLCKKEAAFWSFSLSHPVLAMASVIQVGNCPRTHRHTHIKVLFWCSTVFRWDTMSTASQMLQKREFTKNFTTFTFFFWDTIFFTLIKKWSNWKVFYLCYEQCSSAFLI